MNDILVPVKKLSAFCRACFQMLGLPASHAALTTDNLIFANVRGVDSHGVIRLKIYADRLRVGGFKTKVRPKLVSERPASALIDAQHGIGQVAAMEAMKLAINKAKKTGAAVVSVRHSNHFGASAFYAMRALDHGMIGLALTNAGPSMAPTGGCQGRLGNNAFAVAVPAGRYPPIVLDMATGAVAWGKIFVAQQKKQQIPPTWALDKNGVPTTDPNAAAHQGLIQPFGGYKGYGLSFLIDILTGVLSGSGFSTQVNSLYQQIDKPSKIAHLCAAVRVDAFLPLAAFRQRMDEIIDLMHSCPPAMGADRIYVPGEIECEIEKQRRVEGIPINAELQEELRTLGKDLKVKAPF